MVVPGSKSQSDAKLLLKLQDLAVPPPAAAAGAPSTVGASGSSCNGAEGDQEARLASLQERLLTTIVVPKSIIALLQAGAGGGLQFRMD